MAEVLFEGVNHNGNIQAIVEADERTCYFYLYGAPDIEFGVKSVWVRNLAPAPDELDVARMREGTPPLNPKAFVRDRSGNAPPRAEDLRVVWLPEGNAAALYERNEMLAVVPPWSGAGGFHGYARDCEGEGPLAWKLDADNVLRERFEAADRFWSAWDNGDPWKVVQEESLARIERALGRHTHYYAIDGGTFPPRALLRIAMGEAVALVTIGVCILPQPRVEMYTEEPETLRRIELGAVVPSSWPEDSIRSLASYLSGQARYPWHEYTWLGPGHTIPCDAWRSTRFTSAVLAYDHPGAPSFDLGMQFGDPVSLLWFLPITESEREAIVAQGSAAVLGTLPEHRWKEA